MLLKMRLTVQFPGDGAPASPPSSIDLPEIGKAMKTFRTLLVLTAISAVGCADDDDLNKAMVDVQTLSAGNTVVTLTGATGTLVVPFTEPVPAVPAASFEEEVAAAVSVDVHSPRTENIVTLGGDGGEISPTPISPGQFNWSLNPARDEATLTFYNATTAGLTLKAGFDYNVRLAVGLNDYVQRVGTTTFRVLVQ